MSSSSRSTNVPGVNISLLSTPTAPLFDKIFKQIERLVEAVGPEKQQGSLTARNRLAATSALESLVSVVTTYADSDMGASAVVVVLRTQPGALSALAQVHAMALRAVSEAGGAARAAAVASSRSASGCSEAVCNMNTPKASSAGAWVEALRFSSELLALLFETLEKLTNYNETSTAPPGGSGEPADSGSGKAWRNGCNLASALLRSDALPALSRLLAAEEHRGTAAVLDTDTVVHSLRPLGRLLGFAIMCPWNSRLVQGPGTAVQPQPQLLGPALLRALAASGVVEHVCRFAVTRLAGQQAGGGMGTGGTEGLSAEERSRHLWDVQGLLCAVASLANAADQQDVDGSADANAVRLSPYSQVSRGYPLKSLIVGER